jgi:prephenate dehydratase
MLTRDLPSALHGFLHEAADKRLVICKLLSRSSGTDEIPYPYPFIRWEWHRS